MDREAHGERQQGPSKKSRHKANNGMRGHPTSRNALKSNIRDVTRLLEHSDRLPAGVRIEKERALACYKRDLENAVREKQKQQMTRKYHMVRFFERKKATRNLKKLRSRLATGSFGDSERQHLQDVVHQAEVDVKYTMYYPLTEKYVSLFPRGRSEGPASPRSNSSPGVAGGLVSEKSSMWKVVKQCMEEGTLDALRDGRLSFRYSGEVAEVTDGIAKDQAAHNKIRQGIKNHAPAALEASNGPDGDSDGGFFEP